MKSSAQSTLGGRKPTQTPVTEGSPHKHPSLTTTDYHDGSRSWQHGAADNSAGQSGAVYVFTRTSNVWSQQAYVKASNTGASDYFGVCVELSDDGGTLAVGAPQEDGNATGINGNQDDNSAVQSGAVYVFR
jgi:hypothetical protein